MCFRWRSIRMVAVHFFFNVIWRNREKKNNISILVQSWFHSVIFSGHKWFRKCRFRYQFCVHFKVSPPIRLSPVESLKFPLFAQKALSLSAVGSLVTHTVRFTCFVYLYAYDFALTPIHSLTTHSYSFRLLAITLEPNSTFIYYSLVVRERSFMFVCVHDCGACTLFVFYLLAKCIINI